MGRRPLEPTDLSVPLSHPSALDPPPGACAAPGRGPTWRGVGARPPGALSAGAAFLSRAGPWSLLGLLQAGHHLPDPRGFAGSEKKEGGPSGPPSSVGVLCAAACASAQTLRRGSHPFGCRNGCRSCLSRWPVNPTAIESSPPLGRLQVPTAAVAACLAYARGIAAARPPRKILSGGRVRFRRSRRPTCQRPTTALPSPADEPTAPHRAQRFQARQRRVRVAAREWSADLRLDAQELLADG
jgi:hypothetical protein